MQDIVRRRFDRGAMAAAALSVLLVASPDLSAQRGGGAAGQPGPGRAGNPSSDAPFDPTGYWVSLVSDEWRYRMLTPPKGNVDYVPVNAEGRRVAEQWDPARDEA